MSDTGRVMSDTGSASMLRARGLRKEYGREAGLVRAVDGVDLDVAAGETLAGVSEDHGLLASDRDLA